MSHQHLMKIGGMMFELTNDEYDRFIELEIDWSHWSTIDVDVIPKVLGGKQAPGASHAPYPACPNTAQAGTTLNPYPACPNMVQADTTLTVLPYPACPYPVRAGI
jgi:hypothetical protein